MFLRNTRQTPFWRAAALLALLAAAHTLLAQEAPRTVRADVTNWTGKPIEFALVGPDGKDFGLARTVQHGYVYPSSPRAVPGGRARVYKWVVRDSATGKVLREVPADRPLHSISVGTLKRAGEVAKETPRPGQTVRAEVINRTVKPIELALVGPDGKDFFPPRTVEAGKPYTTSDRALPGGAKGYKWVVRDPATGRVLKEVPADRPLQSIPVGIEYRTVVTGAANPGLEPFDTLMTSFIEQYKVPGAALAVTRNGKLVYARGFGYSDEERKEAVQPDALFRIASVSKPITAVAILQLVAQNKLKLDDKVMDRMKLTPFLAPGTKPDPRWKQITVRQCLQHTGGWDREKSVLSTPAGGFYDPITRPWEIAKALGIDPPVTPVHIVRFIMGKPLDFDPGTRMSYSNVGYLVLGRIIEDVTGQRYEDYVKKEVFRPLGVKAPQLGRALFTNRAQGEVRYYVARKPTGPALFPPRVGQQVPVQYGADNLEGYEAHGGWIASAVDLVKFAAAFDNPARCPILDAKSIQQMWARPDGAAGKGAWYYGCGWSVSPVDATGNFYTSHNGYIQGSEALLVHRSDGVNWAVLFNTGLTPGNDYLSGNIDGRLRQAANTVKVWPNTDQFGLFLK